MQKKGRCARPSRDLCQLNRFTYHANALTTQLLVAKSVAHAPRKIVFRAHIGFFVERLPLILLPVAVWLLADGQQLWALTAFFVLYAWHCGGVGGHPRWLARLDREDYSNRPTRSFLWNRQFHWQ